MTSHGARGGDHDGHRAHYPGRDREDGHQAHGSRAGGHDSTDLVPGDDRAGHSEQGRGHGHNHDHQQSGGIRAFAVSLLRPHSHDAADSVDATLEASREGMTALKVSVAVLAVTAGIQVAVVVLSGSVALLSDTIHNFADALTAVPLGLAFWLGRRPANRRYTYGYGRSEDLAGVCIVVTIALSAGVAAWEAITHLIHPHPMHQVGWVMVAGVVGFAGNELVAVYRVRVGRKIGSAALVADGLHARADGFTSLAVVVGAVGVALGWQLADPIVGLLITAAILMVVKSAARDVYRRLMDAVDPALVEQLSAVLAAVEGVETVEAVRIRWVGHELRAEAEITSDGGLTLAQAHDVAEHAHHHLLHEVPRLAQATIHSSPSPSHGADPHGLTDHHFHNARPSQPS